MAAMVAVGVFLFPARSLAEMRLAILVGSDLQAIDAAVSGIQSIPDLTTEVFHLDRGTVEVDEAVQSLRKFQFDAVVALGARAHEFFLSHQFSHPYAATLVLGDGDQDSRLVPFEATAEEWARAFDHVFPGAQRIGVLATGEREEARLETLRRTLEREGKVLVVQPVTRRTPLTVALRQLLGECSVLFFPRDRGLLQPAVATAILKSAHRSHIPVAAFSRALVTAGAVVALDLSPEKAGERAARRALGLSAEHISAAITVNQSRAHSLGIRLPGDLLISTGGTP